MYDVVIIGAGPAGIFTALELVDNRPDLKVVMLEKGEEVEKRVCPRVERATGCLHCSPCFVVSGWGGAGAFSDGKVTLTSEFGGFLHQYVPRHLVDDLIFYVDRAYVRFGATNVVYGTDESVIRELKKKAATAGLDLVPAQIRHLGTENCARILKNMRDYLEGKVEVRTRTPVANIVARDDKAFSVVTARGEEIRARYIVAAPGREGAEWFTGQARRLNLKLANNPVDIGVRVELPAVVMEHLTEPIYESKLIYYSKAFDDPIRTFCMCPHGEVVMENNAGLITVNGHSFEGKKTENTNFAILVSKTFTEPFKEPIAYGKYIASLANMLGGGVLVQRLGDLLSGRRSTEKRIQKGMVRPTMPEATPGDLSLVLPYRHLINILEMLQALDKIAPGVYNRSTLLYGVEVKFYSSRLEVNSELETRIRNLFVAGDGAGITRGLAQASASGVHVARQILKRVLQKEAV